MSVTELVATIRTVAQAMRDGGRPDPSILEGWATSLEDGSVNEPEHGPACHQCGAWTIPGYGCPKCHARPEVALDPEMRYGYGTRRLPDVPCEADEGFLRRRRPAVYEQTAYLCGGCGDAMLFERDTDRTRGLLIASCARCQRTVRIDQVKVDCQELSYRQPRPVPPDVRLPSSDHSAWMD